MSPGRRRGASRWRTQTVKVTFVTARHLVLSVTHWS